MKTKKRNPKLWLACGQRINASEEKCTDLARHAYTEEQWDRVFKPALHTPGPWRIRDKNGDVIPIDGWDGEQSVEVLTVSLDAMTSEEEQEANARLIASAPKLLEALKRLQQAFGYGDEVTVDDRIVNKMDRVSVGNLVLEITGNAIAEAEGNL